MAEERLSIIKLFADKPEAELTIHQISKNIKKSYAFTNKYTHGLISEGILRKKVIGNAIVCSLGLDSEQALGLIMMDSINRKVQFEKSLKPAQKDELAAYLNSMDSDIDDIKTIFMENSTIHIVLKSQIVSLSSGKKISGFKINNLSSEQFIKGVLKLDLPKIIVLKNHEVFWSLIFKNQNFRR
jgi:hypothetical protein